MVFWRIVKQYERMVVLRWGKYMNVRGPGLRLVVPFMDQAVKVDIREQVDRVPTQKYITADNVVVDMDFVIYYKVLQGDDEVRKAVMDIENFRMATINLSFATLRAVIGSTSLTEALSERERIRDQLQVRMDEVTGRWGIKVSQVEINEIDPPPGVKAAMEREKSAAAIKTAEITEAEGARQGAINRAEGALDHINAVAQSADARTMSLQYFDTLRQMGNSPATKFIFPMEFTSMLESFIGSTTRRQNDQ